MTGVRWTLTAVDQLSDIQRYIARTSAVYGERIVERCFDRLHAVLPMPTSGRIVPEFGDPNIREVFEATYRLMYRIVPDGILVVAIVHGRRSGIPEIGLPE